MYSGPVPSARSLARRSVGRVFWPALEDMDVTLVGNVNSPRSVAYVGDVASGLITLGEMHNSAGRVWHLPCAPPVSPTELARIVMEQANSNAELESTPRYLRGCALMQLKVVRADISEVEHELHVLDRAFVLNHSRFTSTFGEMVTEHMDAVRATLEWFKAHPRPVTVPFVERAMDRLPPLARTSRLARRLGSGALALAKS